MPARDGPLCAAGDRPRRQRQGMQGALQQQPQHARRMLTLRALAAVNLLRQCAAALRDGGPHGARRQPG